MPKVKVLHIITRLDKGGSTDETLLTVARLNKGRFDAHLLSGRTDDLDRAVADFIAQEGIDYALIPELAREINPLKDLAAFLKIFHFLKRERFDIVHTHSSKAGILGRWAAKIAGVKIIVHTPHGHVFYGYSGWFLSRLFIYLEKLTSLITDRIITLTERGKQEHILYRIAPRDKFVPIYGGIEIEKFKGVQVSKREEKKILNIPLDSPVIGTVSRLDPVKGNEYFIASLPQIFRLFPDLRVLMVGDGSQREKLGRYAEKLGLSDKVIFTGMLKDIPNILSVFDVFILPSLNEGMGRCLLEAQAMGVPVVATRVGGIPEVVREGVSGILIPSRSPDSIAAAVINLLNDETLRQRMSEEAKKFIEERFSAKAMVEKISNLYEELLGEKH